MIPVVFTDAVVVNPVVVTLDRFAPEPWKLVAVTELIPDTFVALSPIIFPFAFKAFNTVRVFALTVPKVETPDTVNVCA